MHLACEKSNLRILLVDAKLESSILFLTLLADAEPEFFLFCYDAKIMMLFEYHTELNIDDTKAQ